jgi:hypothetical protein
MKVQLNTNRRKEHRCQISLYQPIWQIYFNVSESVIIQDIQMFVNLLTTLEQANVDAGDILLFLAQVEDGADICRQAALPFGFFHILYIDLEI